TRRSRAPAPRADRRPGRPTRKRTTRTARGVRPGTYELWACALSAPALGQSAIVSASTMMLPLGPAFGRSTHHLVRDLVHDPFPLRADEVVVRITSFAGELRRVPVPRVDLHLVAALPLQVTRGQAGPFLLRLLGQGGDVRPV